MTSEGRRPASGEPSGSPPASGHDWQRSRAYVGVTLALMAGFGALVSFPSVASALRITVAAGVTASAACVVASAVAAAVFRACGLSRAYFAADYVESCVVAASYGYLIYQSAIPDSLFWCFYVFHAAALAAVGRVRRNALLLGTVPLTLVVVFITQGNIMAAMTSAVVCGFGIVLYSGLAQAFTDFEAARRREAELKVKLAAIRVAAERSRIAEDLHDGVGADLAALVWRVRSLAAGTGSGGAVSPGDLAAIEGRIADTIERLREAVVDLRRRPPDWEEVSSILNERCRELCGPVELLLDLQREPGTSAPSEIHAELVRIVIELVRNAARHAHARRIDVLVSLGSVEARLRVADDGKGMGAHRSVTVRGGGGLDHLRRRVEELAGTMEIRSGDGGTRVEVVLPLGKPLPPPAFGPAGR